MPIKVSIVEDNEDLRKSLQILINGSEGFKCISAYNSGEEALNELPAVNVDVVLMDINLPNMTGIECTRKLTELNPKIQIIMQTIYEDSEKIFESLKAGASGYLLKRTPPAKLLEAIEDVSKGGSPMTSQIARMVVESFKSKNYPEKDSEPLSKREIEILESLSKGYRYKEIADNLFISIDTVRSHIRNIYEKLHVKSRTEAVVKYLKK